MAKDINGNLYQTISIRKITMNKELRNEIKQAIREILEDFNATTVEDFMEA